MIRSLLQLYIFSLLQDTVQLQVIYFEFFLKHYTPKNKQFLQGKGKEKPNLETISDQPILISTYCSGSLSSRITFHRTMPILLNKVFSQFFVGKSGNLCCKGVLSKTTLFLCSVEFLQDIQAVQTAIELDKPLKWTACRKQQNHPSSINKSNYSRALPEDISSMTDPFMMAYTIWFVEEYSICMTGYLSEISPS